MDKSHFLQDSSPSKMELMQMKKAIFVVFLAFTGFSAIIAICVQWLFHGKIFTVHLNGKSKMVNIVYGSTDGPQN
jgi:hypothetical protein